jgi:hypothetical protein
LDHYLEIDQEFLDSLSPSLSQKEQEEGGGGDRNSLYDVVLTESSQLHISPEKEQEEGGGGDRNSVTVHGFIRLGA